MPQVLRGRYTHFQKPPPHIVTDWHCCSNTISFKISRGAYNSLPAPQVGSQARLVWQDAGQPPILYLSVGEKTDFGVQSNPSGHSVRNVEFTHRQILASGCLPFCLLLPLLCSLLLNALGQWRFASLPLQTRSLLLSCSEFIPSADHVLWRSFSESYDVDRGLPQYVLTM